MELLAIKSDLAFRAVFGRECDKCKQALMALLNDVLNLDIKALSYANPLNLQNYAEDKKSEMDIEVITNSGERIDIEIQLLRTPGFDKRMVYYGSKLIADSLDSGEDYLTLNKCKVLSILDFPLFPSNTKLQNRFRLKETEDNFELTDVLELIFLEMGKLDETKPIAQMSALERWTYFLKYADDESKQAHLQDILQESEGIHMAMEILKEVSADEQLRTRIRFQEKAERDRQARLNYAKWEGRKEGLEEGLEKGLKKGIAKGLTKGRNEEKLAIARNLLDILDDATIAAKTGLDLEQVADLRAVQGR